MTDKPTVLFVDDESELLEGMRLGLRKRYNVAVASSGAEGLSYLAETREAGVDAVVSDMRMPQMSGAQFLTAVRERHPELPRILLTGQADLDAAIAAVNDARVFRFLTKPCPPELLTETIDEAIEQSRLRTVERDLLDQTLSGAVGMLTDVLGLVSVGAYSKTMRIVDIVTGLCRQLERDVDWDLLLAARLSQIGCVVVGDDHGDLLPGSVALHSTVAGDLLTRIPRLETVAEIVSHQQDTRPAMTAETLAECGDTALKTELLRLAYRFDDLVSSGESRVAALALLAAESHPPPEFLLTALGKVKPSSNAMVEIDTTADQLAAGMKLTEDVMTTTGSKLAAEGVTLTTVLVGRIRTFGAGPGIVEPIRVLAPLSMARELAR
ncbi:MAG: response regulator [Acidimicrobiales bacterium]